MAQYTAPHSLKDFISILRREQEIVEITTEVDPYLEVAEIHRRIIEMQGPALLFRRVKGAAFPLVTNLFGTMRRVNLAFGSRPETLVKELASFPHTLLPPSLSKLWQHRKTLFSLAQVGIKRSSSNQNLIVDTPARLDRLPLLTTWPLDGGPFITLPLVYTEDPETGMHNLGMYRIQRYDESTTGLHCQIGKGGGYHLLRAKELGRKLPVHISVGGPPALILAAIAPLPENVPELLFTSFMLGGRLRQCKNPLGPLPLVESAEFTLVGEVDPNEVRPEGPFGDHYGYYSLQHDYPVFRAKGLIRQPDAIFPATVVGKPRQEDFFIGEYLQQLLAPLFPLVMPNVRDLWSYGETGFHSLAAAVIKERYEREAISAACRILGEGQLTLTKFLLILDKQINLKDFREVLEYVLSRTVFERDLYILGNTAMDTLDYAGPKVNSGSKGVLIGCGDEKRRLPREFTGVPPSEVSAIKVFCGGCLVVQGPSYEAHREFGQVVAGSEAFREWSLIVLVDNADFAASSSTAFLWTAFTRFEPARDLYAASTAVHRNHLAHSPPLVIDARMKPWYPGEVLCDDDTAALVTRRWKEYFS